MKYEGQMAYLRAGWEILSLHPKCSPSSSRYRPSKKVTTLIEFLKIVSVTYSVFVLHVFCSRKMESVKNEKTSQQLQSEGNNLKVELTSGSD